MHVRTFQIHLEEKSQEDSRYNDLVERARREARDQAEQQIRELKEQHKLEMQEGTYNYAQPQFNSASFLLFLPPVLQRHQTTLNNAKNLSESESRLRLIRAQKEAGAEAEKELRAELDRMRSRLEADAKDREEKHRAAIEEYRTRDEAWQEEKRVSGLHGAIIAAVS